MSVFSRSVFLPDSLSLHLSNHQVLTVQVSDTGRYVCVADNVAGSAEKSFNLNVHGESHVNQYITFTVHCLLAYFSNL